MFITPLVGLCYELNLNIDWILQYNIKHGIFLGIVVTLLKHYAEARRYRVMAGSNTELNIGGILMSILNSESVLKRKWFQSLSHCKMTGCPQQKDLKDVFGSSYKR